MIAQNPILKVRFVITITDVSGREDLLARVLGAAQEIQRTPGVMERVYQNISRNERGGHHIEPLL